MGRVDLSIKNINTFVDANELEAQISRARVCNEMLDEKTGKGSDFLGWVDLPSSISNEEITKIKSVASRLRRDCELVVVIGIGGSYLGAKAVIDSLSNSLTVLDKSPKKDPIIVYAGHQISGSYAAEIKELIGQYETGVVVISKSGTTTEPAIAFRFIKDLMEEKYGKENSVKRIVAITDESRGALKKLSTSMGYDTFVIPDNVGGRFSVLTAVGLLPIAIAGFDIQLLLEGAKEMKELSMGQETNIVETYAAVRNLLYKQGKKIEMFASFEPKLQYMAEWWKQLYGESEGKDSKGIFPASVIFSTDLHSMGQYIQDGERHLFETFVKVKNVKSDMEITMNVDNLDGLNFLSGVKFSEVNAIAQQATILAHVDGGVPCMELTIDKLDEMSIGALIYFYERACGVSGYMLEVNPFDQPGVEAYKNNMYALLGKAGYEELKEKLQARL